MGMAAFYDKIVGPTERFYGISTFELTPKNSIYEKRNRRHRPCEYDVEQKVTLVVLI